MANSTPASDFQLLRTHDSWRKVNVWGAIAALAVLTFAIYGISVKFGFNGEDTVLFRPLREYSILHQGGAVTDMYFRPLWHLWMALEYELYGYNPMPIHLTNLLMHCANLAMAMLVMRRLGFDAVSVFATLAIWTMLGGNAYAITWPNETSDLLSEFFLLASFATGMLYFRDERPRYAILAVAAFIWLCSAFTKEMGVLLPFVMLTIGWIYARFAAPSRAEAMHRLRVAGGVLLLAFVFWVVVKIRMQGLDAGLNVTKYHANIGLAQQPLPKVVLGHIVHYFEGLFYLAMPMDLVMNEGMIWVCLAAGVTMVALLLVLLARRVRSGQGIVAVIVPLGCMMAFCLHTSFNPHPRTLYVPTLWFALLLVTLLQLGPRLRAIAGVVPARRARNGLIGAGLTVFLLLHLHLGQNVLSLFSPGSDNNLMFYKYYLGHAVGPQRTPEAVSYSEHQLRYIDMDKLVIPPDFQSYGERGIWRNMVRKVFLGAGDAPPPP